MNALWVCRCKHPCMDHPCKNDIVAFIPKREIAAYALPASWVSINRPISELESHHDLAAHRA